MTSSRKPRDKVRARLVWRKKIADGVCHCITFSVYDFQLENILYWTRDPWYFGNNYILHFYQSFLLIIFVDSFLPINRARNIRAKKFPPRFRLRFESGDNKKTRFLSFYTLYVRDLKTHRRNDNRNSLHDVTVFFKRCIAPYLGKIVYNFHSHIHRTAAALMMATKHKAKEGASRSKNIHKAQSFRSRLCFGYMVCFWGCLRVYMPVWITISNGELGLSAFCYIIII